MIPSIDYLTLVIAGAVLFFVGTRTKDPGRLEVAVTFGGTFLFIVGTGRAFMSAFGL